MSHSRRDFTRYIGYAATAVVVATPIALAAASWVPLEPPPRLSRADEENVAVPEAEKQRRPRDKDKDQKQRPIRDERKPKNSS